MLRNVSPEQRVLQDHPLRPVRAMMDTVLKGLSGRFARLHSKVGRLIDRAAGVVATH